MFQTWNKLQSSPAVNNAIRGVEESGNIAKQRFARTRWVRGLTWQYGRHDIASGRYHGIAIEWTTSKQRYKWFRGYGHLACKVLWVDVSLILVNILNGFLDHVLVSRLYPKQEQKQREPQSTAVQCASNMMQNKAWYVGCNMQCMRVLRKEKIEPGLNLANQERLWKDELISVEIDIKITGIGCTVCKWQAKQ